MSFLPFLGGNISITRTQREVGDFCHGPVCTGRMASLSVSGPYVRSGFELSDRGSKGTALICRITTVIWGITGHFYILSALEKIKKVFY